MGMGYGHMNGWMDGWIWGCLLRSSYFISFFSILAFWGERVDNL